MGGATLRRCNATVPCVNAQERHELMLLRMSDVITNGIRENLPINEHLQNGDSTQTQKVTASQLCKNLLQFAYHLSKYKIFF